MYYIYYPKLKNYLLLLNIFDQSYKVFTNIRYPFPLQFWGYVRNRPCLYNVKHVKPGFNLNVLQDRFSKFLINCSGCKILLSLIFLSNILSTKLLLVPPKMRNNYGANKMLFFNIAIALLDFSLLLHAKLWFIILFNLIVFQ